MTTENPEPLTPGVEAFLKRWEETRGFGMTWTVVRMPCTLPCTPEEEWHALRTYVPRTLTWGSVEGALRSQDSLGRKHASASFDPVECCPLTAEQGIEACHFPSAAIKQYPELTMLDAREIAAAADGRKLYLGHPSRDPSRPYKAEIRRRLLAGIGL